MFATLQVLAALLPLAVSGAHGTTPVPTARPDLAAGLATGREELARYQWRLRTEMKVDGVSRLVKLEDVHLGPDGGLVTKKTVKYDKRPEPTPFPRNDPRASSHHALTSIEEERLAETAMDVMQLYARLSPDVVRRWQEGAELLPPAADRKGLLRMKGRGLGRPQDEATLYLDEKSRVIDEIEVKTTVAPEIRDIAFLRAEFEKLPAPGAPPGLRIPGRVFLNMQFQGRRVTLEMTTTDFSSWP